MLKKVTPQLVWSVVKKIPGTLSVATIILLAGILTKSLWSSVNLDQILNLYGYGIPALAAGKVWTVLTGLVVAPQPYMYATILVTFIVGAGYLEYKVGLKKMLAVFVLSHVLALLVSYGIILLFEQFNVAWAVAFARTLDIGMSNAGLGLLGAATAGFTVLWKKRVRFLVLIYLVAMLLYSGVIWDLTHLVAFIVGVLLGPWAYGRAYTKKEFPTLSMGPREYISGLVLLHIFSVIVQKVYPGNGGIINFNNALNSQPESFTAITISTVVSALFLYGLYKGRRIAWAVTLGIAIINALTYLILVIFDGNFDFWFWLGFNALLTGLLIFHRKQFAVSPDKQTRKNLLAYALIGAVSVIVLHSLLIFGFRTHFTPQPTFSLAVQESLAQTVGGSLNKFQATTPFIDKVHHGIVVAWGALALILLAMLISSTLRITNKRENFDVFDKLMRQQGSTPLTWMARWEGMAYWANKAQSAAFAYRLVGNVAIVFPDPVGAPRAVGQSIRQFEEFCAKNGWTVCYFSVRDKTATALAAKGYAKASVGEDSVIYLKDLEFAGKKWQSVRSAINGAEKRGMRMETFALSQASPEIRQKLRDIADSWVADKSLPEMGFTLGTLKEAEDPEVIMHIAIDESGMVHGMTSWMPVYEKGKIIGRTIDIMQRSLDENAAHGIMEYLIAKSAMKFKEQGEQFISLSAAPLANSSEHKTSLEKLMLVLADRLEPYYGFKSLFNFKKKFQPVHVPIYLCYKDEAQLPAISSAIGRAYMNDMSYAAALTSIAKKKLKK